MFNEKRQVLIIEPDVNLLERLNPLFMLEPDFALQTATSAGDGYAKAQQVRPDFVVITNPLPDAEALSLMTSLRPLLPQAKFIIVLEVENPMLTAQCMGAGANYVLVKPYAADRLIATLKELAVSSGAQPTFGGAGMPSLPFAAQPPSPTVSSLGALRQAMNQFEQQQHGQPVQGQPFQPPFGPQPYQPQPQGGFAPNGFPQPNFGSPQPYAQPLPQPGPNVLPFGQPALDQRTGSIRTIKQTVIAVNSPKGGVGKTTIAKELALAYASVRINGQPLKVCLVDCDLDFGDAASMLALSSYPNITLWTADIAKRLQMSGGNTDIRYPQAQIEQFLLTHQPTGLKVLAAPTNHSEAINIEGDQMQVVLKNLRNCDFDVIILDTGNNTKDSTLVALDEANIILMVCTMDVAAINDANMLLNTLRQCQFPMGKIKLVMNKLPKTDQDIDLSEIEQILQSEIIATIPDYPRMRQLNNSGSPAVLDRDTEFSVAIRRLGHTILPVFNQRVRIGKSRRTGAQPNKRGLLSRLFKK